MSNTRKRALPAKIMIRVETCAILFLDSSRKDKINRNAEEDGIAVEEAATAYTLGALKAAKRRGTARNYREALEKLEAEQVGDRGSRITRSISADSIASTVARINRVNAGNRDIPDYYSTMDKGTTWTPHYPKPMDSTQHTSRNMGKVLGTLYTEWEDREAGLDPALIAHNKAMQAEQSQVEKNLKAFFAEYESRLSKTAKTRLHELAESTVSPNYLMGHGMTDPDTKRIAWSTYRLYESFPHRDSISGIEFICLIRKYINPPPNRA
jgi:ribonuclease HII